VALAFCVEGGEADPVREALDRRDRELRASHRPCVQTLSLAFRSGEMGVRDLSLKLSAEADRCIGEALDAALAFVTARHGPAPGRCGVLALGKLGSREMTQRSDLDLVFVYDCPDEAAEFFDRAAKSLVGSLTWGADFDPLYDADMRLRPHGEDGPIAVPLSGLRAYYESECWTWELQALTRARFVAGDEGLGAEMMAAIGASLGQIGQRAKVREEVAAMRALLEAEKPPKTEWDQKRAPGGLIDIEFIVQALQLEHAGRLGDMTGRRTDDAIEALRDAGVLTAAEARDLLGAHGVYSMVQHVQAAWGEESLDGLGGDLRKLMLKRLHAPSLPALQRRIAALRSMVRGRFEALVGKVEGEARVGFAA
jgi:glutamate-ammonia-ligase adenylyltransferase